MQKLISILFITSLLNVSHAGYLDDWSNDDLCGWMESSSTPKHILDEVDKRSSSIYHFIVHYDTRNLCKPARMPN